MSIHPPSLAYQGSLCCLQLSFYYTNGRPLPPQSFIATLNHSPISLSIKENGIVLLPILQEADWDKTLVLDHCEMLDLKTGYPTHKQMIPLMDYKNTKGVLKIFVLPPPIVIHLGQETTLSAEQLQYFKEHGNNVLLFIHGFRIGLGEYGCYPEHYEIQDNILINEPHFKMHDESSFPTYIDFKSNHYTRTICCDLTQKEELETLFPELSLCYKNYFSQYCAEKNPEGFGKENAIFNGTGARQWFVHMEYNFNRAAGFAYPNYHQYTRILGVYWPGNLSSMDFTTAEEIANAAGKALLQIILQLIADNIRIHIVAHSLGCRVALQMLQQLTQYRKEHFIECLILWQAAIPHTVFNHNGIFLKTLAHVEKIIILYSRQDRILQTLYHASHLRTVTQYKALGYRGIHPNADIIHLQKSGKILLVDQSKHLFGHSFMKIPTLKLMQEIYQEYIIGGSHGIRHFGRYTLS